MTKIFVSYRRSDSAYVAAAITEKLEQRFGTGSVFYDIDSIPLGIDFRAYISNAVGECDILLAIIGDNWVDAVDEKGSRRLDDPADFVRLELESALRRKIPVVPILVGKANIPPTNALPSSLQALTFRNAAEVRPGRDLQQHLVKLVTGLELLRVPEHEQPVKVSTIPTKPQIISSESFFSGSENTSNTVSKASSLERDSPQPANPLRAWVRGTIVLIVSIIVGWGCGLLTAEALGNRDMAGFIVATPVWLIGLLLTIRIWKSDGLLKK